MNVTAVKLLKRVVVAAADQEEEVEEEWEALQMEIFVEVEVTIDHQEVIAVDLIKMSNELFLKKKTHIMMLPSLRIWLNFMDRL